jgi:hypothetical protein
MLVPVERILPRLGERSDHRQDGRGGFRLLSSRHVGGIRGHRQLGEFRCWNFCNLRRIRQGCKKLFPIRRKRACRFSPAERKSTATHSVSQTTLPPHREVSAKRIGLNRIRQAEPNGPFQPRPGHRPFLNRTLGEGRPRIVQQPSSSGLRPMITMVIRRRWVLLAPHSSG